MPRAQIVFVLSLCSIAVACHTDGDLETSTAAIGGGQVCPPGESWVCYTGPSDTDSVGVCDRGVKTCNVDGSGYGPCVGEVVPSAELCDGLDNDCDGATDDACSCTPGEASACYDGPAGTEGEGICAAGTHVCNADGVGFGACVGWTGPAAEMCGDGVDNDCDGNLDQGCVCPPGETWDCYGHPFETDGIGVCQRGTMTCAPDGLDYGACVGEVGPSPEVCNGLDDDCDGTTDEGCTACVPVDEVCGDGLDNDCDELADEDCVCAPGSLVACYDGPPGTAGVGTCTNGVRTCDANGMGYGACVGTVGPTAEVCGDGLDNDCDGATDEGCVCAPGSTVACYDGPPGTEGVGACDNGVATCDATGTGFGACIGWSGPSPEVCGDGLDNDCDGASDEGCVCTPGSLVSCYLGPPGTFGVGTCEGGLQMCNPTGTGYGACVGSIGPIDEVCGDGLDNDCDGASDEGCGCIPTTEVCGDGEDNDCDGLFDERCIGDRAWNDRNRNGVQEAGEAGLAGVTLFLRTSTGAAVDIVTSNADGWYYFANTPPGTYFIEIIPPPTYGLSGKDLGGNENVDSDFDGEDMRTDNFVFPNNGSFTHIDGGMYSSTGS